MVGFVRRVVTGHNAQGRSVVLSDGLTPTLKTHPLRPGHRSTEIWRTAATPAPLTASESDPTLPGPGPIHPAPCGTVFRIAEWAPEAKEIRDMSPDTAHEIFRAMGNENASMHGRGGRHPIMHRTETIDYAVILDGELTMILDEGEVVLKQGDVVVQRGTSHSWVNRSDKPCKILFVLIDGAFDAGLREAFENK